MLVSIIIRTLNESKYLGELLLKIKKQEKNNFDIEVVIVDSGSTDGTLKIAEDHGCKITFINKEDFTFGRSINIGSEFANGDILVYVSGHCIPCEKTWLRDIISPILLNDCGYSYGGQLGRDTTKYSETKIFKKYFPSISAIPQEGFFAIMQTQQLIETVWSKYKFNEEITGLEDIDLAKRYFMDGGKIAYVAEASVFHIHDESWHQTRRRYEREAMAMQRIMPEIHVGLFDTLRYIFVSIISDSQDAISDRCFVKEFFGIIAFRIAQFSGAYRGNHSHRKLSKRKKENYYYPKRKYRNNL